MTFNGTDALIVQNLIYNNNAPQGPGIYISGAIGRTRPDPDKQHNYRRKGIDAGNRSVRFRI
jgi:hypothetical protein